MRTKISIQGHAVHQMLIPFPAAFLTGSLIFDLIGRLLNDGTFWQTGFYIGFAGIVMGLVAAVPGFLDFMLSVPPESTANKRALKHMSIMVTTLIIFGISLYLRKRPETMPENVPLILEAIGAAALTMGAWMGGTLVNRNFIGPDPRYANSGKWKEADINRTPENELVVADADELKIDQMKLIKVDGKRIALGRTEDGYAAFDDHCTHRGGPLAGGVMICSTVQCLWHGSQFNVKTGQVKAGPAKESIKTYNVEVRNGKVILKI